MGRTDVQRDRGVTLTELLIVVAIMGVISVALASTFSVIVRTTPGAQARADDARSLLGLSTWLPQDVGSTPHQPLGSPAPNWDRSPTRATGCAGGDEGINLLRLAWSETIGPSTSSFVAAYRYAETGSGWVVQRVTCRLGAQRTTQEVSSALPAIDIATWAPGNYPVWVEWRELPTPDGIEVVGVTFEVETIDGDRVRIDASSANPQETLSTLAPVVTAATSTAAPTTSEETTTTTTDPTVTTTTDPSGTTSTTTPPTTSTTTTTTIPCTASITGINPNPVRNQNGSGSGGSNKVNGPLNDPVTVTITKSGSCGDLGLEYLPSPSSSRQWIAFGTRLEVLLPASELEIWEDGARGLILRNGQSGPQIGATAVLNVS